MYLECPAALFSFFVVVSSVISSEMSAYAALSLVLREHGGYLASYAVDACSRLLRCVELVNECESSARAISASVSASGGSDLTAFGLIMPLWSAMARRILRFAPALTPPPGPPGKPLYLCLCKKIFDESDEVMKRTHLSGRRERGAVTNQQTV